MRIIAGRHRGRRLRAPEGRDVRPTSDSLRETLFNIIAARVEGARVLDGYAGTGAIGLEALSRGASRVTFVERDRRALAILASNVALCSAADEAAIVRDDFVRLNTRTGSEFDVGVVDPPYDTESYEPILLAAAAQLAPGGIVIVEHSRRRTLPALGAHLRCQRVVTAGDSALSFYAEDPADLRRGRT